MTQGKNEQVLNGNPDERSGSGVAPTGADTPEEQAPASLEQLQAELEAARAQAAEHLDKFLRAKAEAENTRRRAEIDVASAHKYALEQFAGQILAVRDSLELARSVELGEGDSAAVERMREGLDLTLKLMDGIFQKFGLVRIDPAGEKFDPERHQAISTVESDEVAPNHVVNVVQKGYLLNDRLLRPAMVVVARAP